MEPVRNSHATLVDLLDRVLDKGIIIYADLIVSLAGIPLIGVNLRAAIAGMETMLKYGMMKEWDDRVRSYECERIKSLRPFIKPDQKADEQILTNAERECCESAPALMLESREDLVANSKLPPKGSQLQCGRDIKGRGPISNNC